MSLQFLNKLNTGKDTGYTNTWTLPDKETTWYKRNQRQSQYEKATAQTGKNVFFSINPTKTPKSSSQRATNKEVSELSAIFLDLDGRNDKKPNNPETTQELIDLLDGTMLPPPNYIVATGGGIHAYYIVEGGYPITDDESRQNAEALTKGFTSVIQSEGKKRGYSFDSCQDLARVGRMPGSYNNKGDTPKLVEIVRQSDETYSFQELCEFIPKPEVKTLKARQNFKAKKNEKPSDGLAKFDPIYEGCPFVKNSIDNSKTLEEPIWYHTLTIASRCEDGRAVCHQISEGYADYDFDETERKITHALSESSGPTTCKYIADTLAFSGCKSCPIRQTGKLTSPIGLGFIQSELAKVVSKYVYCLTTNQYFEVGA